MILRKTICGENLKADNFCNKLFALVFFALLASQNTFAQDYTDTIILSEEEQVWIAEHPVITASSNIALAPFDFISAGQPAGLSIDYLNLIGTKVGLKIDYVNFETWAKAIERAKSNEIDIIHSISKNEERAKYLNFSAPYYNIPIVNFGRVGSQKINSISDLEDKRIGILRGHIIGETYKEKYPHFDLIEFNTHTEVIRALASDKIDIYTAGAASIEFLISQNNIPGLEIIGDDFVLENKIMDERIGVHKDNPVLMTIVNKAIAAISDEELKALSEKWIKASPFNYDIRLTTEELDWLSKNKVIKVAADFNSPPYEFIDSEGKISGIAGDYLNEISRRLNIEFVWAGNKSWNEGLIKIRDHDADLIAGITPTKDREGFLKFTEIYVTYDHAIYSRINGIHFGNLESLNGHSVAQVKGSVVVEYLRQNHPDIKIIEVDRIRDAIELASKGDVDAHIGDILWVNSLTPKIGNDSLIVTGLSPYKLGSAMGVQPDLPYLASSIQKAFADIDPTIRQQILTKWLTIKLEPKVDYGPLWYVIGFSLFTGIIILIWNNSLRREVSKRITIEKKLNTAQSDLIYALKEARESSDAKSNFLTSMSHDLRTPLNAIIGFSETINKEIFGSINNKKYAEYNQDIYASGKYLLQLVNDIMDISALEAKKRKLYYETIDISELVLECQRLVHKLAEDKNINLIINIPEDVPPVYADRKAMMQILMNLITNSIKFTPNEGSITISSHASSDNHIIQVSDTGCGIAEGDIKLVTDPFMRAVKSPFVSHEEGTGLGLAIVASLVDLHGGKLVIDSILDKSTTVTVSLPLIAAPTDL